MLSLDPKVVGWLAVVANLLVQLVKGLLPDWFKKYVPPVLVGVLMAIGCGLAWYVGRDPVVGLAEGFFAAMSAVGLYETASILPGVKKAFTSSGWIRRG